MGINGLYILVRVKFSSLGDSYYNILTAKPSGYFALFNPPDGTAACRLTPRKASVLSFRC